MKRVPIAACFLVLIALLWVAQPATPQKETGVFSATPSRVATDHANSTTTPLANGDTFKGVWALSNYPDLMVSIKTDQDGSGFIDFSPDGVNPDSSVPFNYDADGINPPHRLTVGHRYHRVRFTNDSGTNQTYFRLHTSLGEYRQLTTFLNGTSAKGADTVVTRPVPFNVLAAIGRVGGWTVQSKFGRNSSIGTATDPEDVWEGGGTYTGQPACSSAETVDVISTSDEDTLTTGTGAWTVTLVGLDANFLEQTETVNLGGTGGVTSSNTWCRVPRAFVATGATITASNVGAITVQHTTTTANKFIVMPAGSNQSQVAAFTVPANKTAVLTELEVNVSRGAGQTSVVTIYVLTRGSGGVYRVRDNLEVSNDVPGKSDYLGIALEPLTDVVVRAQTVSGNDTNVSARLGYYLIED